MPFRGHTRHTYTTPNTGEMLGEAIGAFIAKKKRDREDEEAQTVTEQLLKRMQGQEQAGTAQSGGPLLPDGGPYKPLTPQSDDYRPAVEADPMGAAMAAATHPRTKDNPTIQALMAQQLKAKDKLAQTSNSGKPWIAPQQVMVDGKPTMIPFDFRKGQWQYGNVPRMPGSDAPISSTRYDDAQLGRIAESKEQGKKDVQLEMNPKIKKQTDIAAHQAELVNTKPQRESIISSSKSKMNMLDKDIDLAIDNARWYSTGLVAQATSGIGAGPAHNLSKNLDSIKANIGFDRLQEMRNNSKTGGALGQVSERENALLQAVWGSLEQSQGGDQFKANLEKVRKQVKESWRRINEAFRADYGHYPGQTEAPTQTNDPLGIR